MAVFNEILAGRFNKGLNKLFSMKGPAPAPQLASEIMPTLQLFLGIEHRTLEGWQRFGLTSLYAASAANVSFLRMRNPKAFPGVIAVIEQVSFDFPVTDEWLTRMDLVNATDLATPLGAGRANAMDVRGPLQPALSLTTTQAVASLVPNLEDVHGLAGGHQYMIRSVNDEIPLLPDQQLTFQTTTVNVIAVISVRWRERVLEESESLNKAGG